MTRWCVLVCRRRRPSASCHFPLPFPDLPWNPLPLQAALPISFSPPCALPLPPWPSFPSLLPFPFPWEGVPTEPPDCPCFPKGGGGVGWGAVSSLHFNPVRTPGSTALRWMTWGPLCGNRRTPQIVGRVPCTVSQGASGDTHLVPHKRLRRWTYAQKHAHTYF